MPIIKQKEPLPTTKAVGLDWETSLRTIKDEMELKLPETIVKDFDEEIKEVKDTIEKEAITNNENFKEFLNGLVYEKVADKQGKKNNGDKN